MKHGSQRKRALLLATATFLGCGGPSRDKDGKRLRKELTRRNFNGAEQFLFQKFKATFPSAQLHAWCGGFVLSALMRTSCTALLPEEQTNKESFTLDTLASDRGRLSLFKSLRDGVSAFLLRCSDSTVGGPLQGCFAGAFIEVSCTYLTPIWLQVQVQTGKCIPLKNSRDLALPSRHIVPPGHADTSPPTHRGASCPTLSPPCLLACLFASFSPGATQKLRKALRVISA